MSNRKPLQRMYVKSNTRGPLIVTVHLGVSDRTLATQLEKYLWVCTQVWAANLVKPIHHCSPDAHLKCAGQSGESDQFPPRFDEDGAQES